MVADRMLCSTQQRAAEAVCHKARRARMLGSALSIALGTAVPACAHGITERVSLRPGGVQDNGDSDIAMISADGRFVAFASVASNLVPGDTNGFQDIFVRDRQTGTTRRMSVGLGGIQGDNHSLSPSISADGRFIAFGSYASNLVPGDTNRQPDVFVLGLCTLSSVAVGPSD